MGNRLIRFLCPGALGLSPASQRFANSSPSWRESNFCISNQPPATFNYDVSGVANPFTHSRHLCSEHTTDL